MRCLDCVEVLVALGRRPEREVNAQFPGVSTDSRTIRPGELFVALKGDNFDGHDFVIPSFERGAGGAVISRRVEGLDAYPDRAVFVVSDTLRALGDLARYLRRKCRARVIGVTGSNGKTTTKEMIHHVLSKYARVSKAKKSFNNFVGVPLTIFGIEPDDEYAVIEMGTNHPGEIAYLAGVAEPDIGVITNVGPTHLEGLGSEEGVANAKAEMLDVIRPDGIGILNADNPWTPYMAPRCRGRIFTFGRSSAADYRAMGVVVGDASLNFMLNERTPIHIPILGAHNVYNALAAIAVCSQVGLSPEQISEGFKDFTAPAMRLERKKVGDILLINDAYNANPLAMKAAAETLEGMSVKGRKVFVFGDMLELGSASEEFHRGLGRLLASKKFDLLFAVGPLAGVAADAAVAEGFDTAKIERAASAAEAAERLPALLRDGDTVLLKASRGIALEKVAADIEKRFGLVR